MRLFTSLLVAFALASACDRALADRPSKPVLSLVSGQWVELRDLDPVASTRDVRHIWLHRGALLFGVTRVEGKPAYRDAVSYLGLPVRILAAKRGGGWHVEKVRDPFRSSFHLTRNVFCPGESSPIVLKGDCLRGGSPVGEGYVFDLRTVDADGDGVADLKHGQKFFAVSIQLDEATAAALDVDKAFEFEIYQTDLERYEDIGVLFRLDRPHPLREVRFLDGEYQPCGSTETSEIKKATALEAYEKAEGKAGFNFWGWLSASLSVGVSGTIIETDENSVKITTTTTEGTTFRQWGLIFDYPDSPDKPVRQTPFFVQKVFECVSTEGQARFGDRIKKVEIGLYDDFTGNNRVFEFNRPEDFQVFSKKVLDKVDKPVFISVNDSETQAAVLDMIKERYEIKDHYLAVFLFSQINLACPENDRAKCVYYLAHPDN